MHKELTHEAHAFAQLLQAKGILTDADFLEYKKHVEEDWTAANGAALCARAWVDPDFKAFLLADGRAAAADMGFPMPEHHAMLQVKENTQTLHNVICCTLCSCTAFTIIGMAPGWYKDLDYRARIVRQARTVLAEMGLPLPDTVNIRVWDTTADTRYMILPMRPAYTAGWPEQQLAALISKEAMIGVARLEDRMPIKANLLHQMGGV